VAQVELASGLQHGLGGLVVVPLALCRMSDGAQLVMAESESTTRDSQDATGHPQLVIGVLAVQGDFAEHAAMLRRAAPDVAVREVRTPADLHGLNGLVVPGGESTTIGKLLVAYGLEQPIRRAAHDGMPVWGTCAGMILLARDIVGGEPDGRIGLMDLTVERNAFGRQVDSFEVDLPFVGLATPIHAVFIRAPMVQHVGPRAEVLAALEDGRVVAARQGNLLATAFHPELTPDTRLHAWFVELCRARAQDSALASATATADT
jgi:5'-phosphate synthase pdxT subunit